MNKEKLLALVRRLRGETLDETPGRDSSDALVCAREQGYRAGWNDRTRRVSTEIETLANGAVIGVTLKEQTERVLASLTPREREVLDERLKSKPAHRVTRSATIAEECAQRKHAVARDDGQCQCGVFFVGFPGGES